MRRKTLLVLLLALVMAAAMATVASAEKPICPDGGIWPKCESTTTTTTVPDPDPEYWTCEKRNANGATWSLGTYDEGAYHGETVPVCIDILEEHQSIAEWVVEWSGETVRGTVKGLKFVFEEEVHDNVFAETVVTSVTSGSEPWSAALDFGGATPGNLVFVAMPHSGDKWTSFSITVTPVVP